MEELIKWLELEIQLTKETREKSNTEIVNKIRDIKIKNLSLTKEYLNDYEKLAKDYRDVVSENRLLKLEKLELEGRHIYEDMRLKYRANRRKWGARYV